MKRIFKIFPITSWAFFAEIISAIMYFTGFDAISLIYNLIGVNSISFYSVLDFLRKVILWPVFWEILVYNPKHGQNGEWLIHQHNIRCELLVFLLLDLLIFYFRRKLVSSYLKAQNHHHRRRE